MFAPPVVFHYMQVRLQGGQEQFQHLRIGSSIDVAIRGSITNLENMEGEVLTPSSSSPLTPDAPTAPSLSPSQTYLAPR